MKYKNWLITGFLIIIICIASLLRFYHIADIPAGITDDEANAGYDAYSLLKTGKDQWDISYPIFSFKGFGDYRSPVYTYLILPLLPVMKMTPFWLRFPAALLGTITVLLVYFIAKRLGFSIRSALIASLLLALNPWHIGMSRTAMVIVTGLFFLCVAMTTLLYAKKRLLFVIASCIFFGITIYAYPAYLLLTPIIMLFIFFLLFKEKNIFIGQIGIGLAVSALIVIPYLISSKSSSYGVRMGQVNIFRDSGTIDLLNEKLGACQRSSPLWVCKLTYNRFTTFGMKLVVNYVRHFSPDLLFSNGTSTQYSVLPQRGLLLSLEYIFFIIGIFYLILNGRKAVPAFLLTVLFFAPIPDSFTGDGHYGRYFVVLPFIQLTAAYGIGKVLQSFSPLTVFPIMFGLIVETSFLSVEYLTYYPYAFSQYSHYGYKELSLKLEEIKGQYDSIYVSGRVNDAKQYIFYLFFTKYDPLRFQTSKDIEKVTESNGWIRVKRIDNIHFVQSFPDEESFEADEGKRILFIGGPTEYPKVFLPSQFDILDKKQNVLFRAVTWDDWKRCLKVDCSAPL